MLFHSSYKTIVMRLKFILTILLGSLYVLAIHAHPQHMSTIEGTVIDKTTQEPLSYINISLEGTQYQTISDENGYFILKNIHEGKYIIHIHNLGYETLRKEIVLEANVVKKIKIELNTNDHVLGEVSVIGSASRMERDLSPIVTSHITAKTFEATQSTTLAQGLNFSPGVRVETTCQNCGSQEVRINGLEGNYSQILVDGQPVVGALTKTYGLDQIPVNMIDEVKVIRGGSSALYASNAIGGIINILTKEPETNYYELKYNLAMIDGKSADNLLTLNTSLVDKNRTSGISIFGNMRNRNPWDANQDGFSEIGKNQSGSLGVRTFLKPSTNNKVAVEYHYISEERRGGDNFDRPPHEAEIAESANYKIHSGAVNFDQFFRDKAHRLNIHASIQDAKRNSYFGAGKEPNGYGNTSEFTLIGNVKYDINTDNLLFMPAKFTLGFTQSHDLLRNNMPGYNYKQTQNINMSTLYFQNEWRNDKLSLAIGMRAEKHSMIDNINIIPRANIRYQIINNLNLRGSYTEGYRAPEITGGDLDIAIQDGKATLLEFAEGIKPERSRSFSAGFDTKFYNENFYSYFLVEGFFTRINNAFIDRLSGESETGNTIMMRENANRATIYGLNFETSIQPSDWLQIDGGFTLQRGQYKSPESWSDDEDVPPTKDLLRSPNQYGFLSAVVTPKSPFSGSVSATYTGPMKVPHLAGYIEQDVLKKTRSFVDMTLKLAYTFNLNAFNKAEISGGIQNLFNQRQKDYDKGANRDADYIYGPALPRTYFIGLKISSF
jgi:outer membrane receptor for ferrienterochelin and colicins